MNSDKALAKFISLMTRMIHLFNHSENHLPYAILMGSMFEQHTLRPVNIVVYTKIRGFYVLLKARNITIELNSTTILLILTTNRVYLYSINKVYSNVV